MGDILLPEISEFPFLVVNPNSGMLEESEEKFYAFIIFQGAFIFGDIGL